METPLSVANYFLKESFKTAVELSPMKLVKLVYISHGWHLGLTGEPLLSEAVEAWKYGPVCPAVYHKFKNYGIAPIRSLAIDALVGDGSKQSIPEVTSDEAKPILDKVWEVYRGFTGLQLSALTHQPDTPWYITWHKNGGKDNQHVVIPNNLIQQHYAAKANAV